MITGGRALNWVGGVSLPNHIKLRMPGNQSMGVRRRERVLWVEGEEAQSNSEGPRVQIEGEGRWWRTDSQDVGAEAAIHSKSA